MSNTTCPPGTTNGASGTANGIAAATSRLTSVKSGGFHYLAAIAAAWHSARRVAANTDDVSCVEKQLSDTALTVAESRAAGVSTDDALRGMRQSRAAKLTAAQRRRVRELMEDEGESRASAVAWVLNMEAEVR